MTHIDDYIKDFDQEQRNELERIRSVGLDTVPEATETIGYGIPTLKYKNKMLISFNAYKDHIGLYPGAAAVNGLKDKLGDFGLSKGTIRYTLEKPISDELLKQTVVMRKEAIDEIND